MANFTKRKWVQTFLKESETTVRPWNAGFGRENPSRSSEEGDELCGGRGSE
jgi:hypothetical protein